MELFHGALSVGDGQALEVAVAHALVRRASRGESGAAVRMYRPDVPVVAFGRRDTLLPGFSDAVRVVREAGFTPVVRAPGGRAVAYTERSLVVDHVSPDPGVLSGIDQRFSTYADLWADVLREHGVDARVGAVPGEYCPGAYSVNARGKVKLIGTAQRLVRGASLLGASVVVGDGASIRAVLRDVYGALEFEWDESTAGALDEEVPGLTLDAVEAAIIAAYPDLEPADLDEDTLALARRLAPEREP